MTDYRAHAAFREVNEGWPLVAVDISCDKTIVKSVYTFLQEVKRHFSVYFYNTIKVLYMDFLRRKSIVKAEYLGYLDVEGLPARQEHVQMLNDVLQDLKDYLDLYKHHILK